MTKRTESVMTERWLSVDEVAEYLGIRRGTVYKWVERLGLPARKIGRLLKFRRSEIDEWIDRRAPRPSPAVHESPARFVTHRSGALIRRLSRAAPDIEKRFGVRRIGIFGSAVRDEARSDGDIDVLVEFTEPTFDRYMDLKFYLEDLFGRKCDLVLADSLKESVRARVLGEVIYA